MAAVALGLLWCAGPSPARAQGLTPLALEQAREQALQSFASSSRWRGLVQSARGYLVHAVDEERLIDAQQLTFEDRPSSYAFVVRGCDKGTGPARCREVGLWIVDPYSGRFQQGGVASHGPTDEMLPPLPPEQAGATMALHGLSPGDPPLLLEVGETWLFWLFSEEDGLRTLVDAWSGDVYTEEAFIDVVREELRVARVANEGGHAPGPPEPYPDEPFPSLRPVTQEQCMFQDQDRSGEANLCGPSALAMVLDYHGEHIPHEKVADVTTVRNGVGTKQRNLERAALFSHTSSPRIRTGDRGGDGPTNGFDERQEGSVEGKRYGWVACLHRYFGQSYDVLDALRGHVELHQPPIVYHKTGINCPTGRGETTGVLCTNGIDDDGDGLTDCVGPDPDCPATTCPNNAEDTLAECNDGGDNDGDGLVDGADPSCQEKSQAACTDGGDNDGDGTTDCADLDCQVAACPRSYYFTGGHYVVATGIYEPVVGDALVVLLDSAKAPYDYWIRNWEAETTKCANTLAEFAPGYETFLAGGRNSAHGRADRQTVAVPMPVDLQLQEDTPVPGRFTISATVRRSAKRSRDPNGDPYGRYRCNLERPLSGCLLETTDYLCAGGVDDDGDGLTDCDDPDCRRNPKVTVCAAFWPHSTENSDTECADNVDNDGDGLTDCGDPSCGENYNVKACDPENRTGVCQDGQDNDGDGLTDCDDPRCRNPLVAACDNTPFCSAPPWPWVGGGTPSIKVQIYREDVPQGTQHIPYSADPYVGPTTVSWDFARDGTEVGDLFKVVVTANLYAGYSGSNPGARYWQDGSEPEDGLWFDQVYGWAAMRMDNRKVVVEDHAGNPVAAFGDQGNVYLKGVLHENVAVSSDPQTTEALIRVGGDVVAKVDTAGDMYVAGVVHENMNDSNDSADTWDDVNKTCPDEGGTYNPNPGIDEEQEYLDTEPPPGRERSLRVVRDAGGNTVMRVDVEGNVRLRGIVLEEYNGFP